MYVSDERQLEDYYQSHLANFIETTLKQDSWTKEDGLRLHYAYAVNPAAKAWVVVMQGRAESVIKYAEVIDELYQNGYSVFAFDHLGQGHSSRQTANPQHGYIDHFDTYIQDAANIIESIMSALKQAHDQHKLSQYLLCHSMGGAIGTLLVAKHPKLFDKVAISSPMYGIRAPIPVWLARILVSLGVATCRLLKLPSGYFLGQTDYKEVDFATNTLTSSKARYRWFKDYYHQEQVARLGGVSYQWLAAALIAMDEVMGCADKIDIPVLMLKAGQDQVVDNQATEHFFSKLAMHNKQANLLELEGAKHEILFERDKYRQPAVKAILRFYAQSQINNSEDESA